MVNDLDIKILNFFFLKRIIARLNKKMDLLMIGNKKSPILSISNILADSYAIKPKNNNK